VIDLMAEVLDRAIPTLTFCFFLTAEGLFLYALFRLFCH